MIDQIYDRHYQQARQQMNRDVTDGLHRLFHSIGKGLAVLNRQQFEAPWAAKSKAARCN